MVRAKHAGAQFQIERTIRRSRSLRGAVRCRRNRQKLEKANATVGSWRLHGEKRKDRARGIPAAHLINDQLQQSDKSESCHLAALIQCVLIPENFFHRHKNQGGWRTAGVMGVGVGVDSTRCFQKAWRIDEPVDKWADGSLT